MDEPRRPPGRPDVPAGWYDDGRGGQRWFDGTEWTDSVVPGAVAAIGSRPARTRPSGAATSSIPPVVLAEGPPPPPYVASPADGPVDDAGPSTSAQHEPATADPGRREHGRGRRLALASVGVVAVCAGIGAGYLVVTGGDEPAGAVGPGRSAAAASATESSADGVPLVSGPWRVDRYRFVPTEDGRLSGTAEVTFTGDTADDGQAGLTFSILGTDGAVATAFATAVGSEPGVTSTIELASSDAYVTGPYAEVSVQQDF